MNIRDPLRGPEWTVQTTYLESLHVGIDALSIGLRTYQYVQYGSRKKRSGKSKREIWRSFTLQETNGFVQMRSDITDARVLQLHFQFGDCPECKTKTVIRSMFDASAQLAMSKWRRQFGPWHRVHMHGNKLVLLELVFKTYVTNVYATVMTPHATSFKDALQITEWYMNRWAKKSITIFTNATPPEEQIHV